MNKLKIMHCLGRLDTGGAETLVINILRNLDKEKCKFDFLLFDEKKGFYDDEVKKLGSQLFYSPNIGSVGLKKYIEKMIEFFKAHDIDIVHSHMDWQGGFIAYAAYKAGIKKIVVHSHADQDMFAQNIIYTYMIKLNKYLIKKYATDLCACSKKAAISLFGKQEFQIITNGIDMNKYLNPDNEKVIQLKNEFGFEDDDIVLGHVGSFSKNKNQEFLINLLNDLLKYNKKYKLLLVGDGTIKKELEHKVKIYKLDKNIIFAGVRKDIPEIMHLLDVFLFPSFSEGLGIVVVEAQASKIPCIVSDSISNEVDLKLGLVTFHSLDKNDWIDIINNNISNNNKVISNSDILNSQYNISNTIEELFKLYKIP